MIIKLTLWDNDAPVFCRICTDFDRKTGRAQWNYGSRLEDLKKIAIKLSLGKDPYSNKDVEDYNFEVQFMRMDAEGDWIAVRFIQDFNGLFLGSGCAGLPGPHNIFAKVKVTEEGPTDSASQTTKILETVSSTESAVIESTTTGKKLDGVLQSFVEVIAAATLAVSTQVERMETAAVGSEATIFAAATVAVSNQLDRMEAAPSAALGPKARLDHLDPEPDCVRTFRSMNADWYRAVGGDGVWSDVGSEPDTACAKVEPYQKDVEALITKQTEPDHESIPEDSLTPAEDTGRAVQVTEEAGGNDASSQESWNMLAEG